MKNAVLKDIEEYAVKKLNEAYGYCGLASGDNAALINSEDRQGNDIEISIKVKVGE